MKLLCKKLPPQKRPNDIERPWQKCSRVQAVGHGLSRRRQLQWLSTVRYVARRSSLRRRPLWHHQSRASAAGHSCRGFAQPPTEPGRQAFAVRACVDTCRSCIAIEFACIRKDPHDAVGMSRRGLAAPLGRHRTMAGQFSTGCTSSRCRLSRPPGRGPRASLGWPEHPGATAMQRLLSRCV